MKKNFILSVCFLVFACMQTIAQKPPALNFPTYRQDADATFNLFDKTKILTHILYDRVYPMADLQDYNDVSDTIAYSRFFYKQALNLKMRVIIQSL